MYTIKNENAGLLSQLAIILLEKGLKIGTAESCTGGLVGHLITTQAGSSVYYMGSITSYTYELKESLLGVKHETLEQYGAVSEETVFEMATGALKALNVDIAVSISGIAGPGGGLPNKPVGTVCFGVASLNGIETTTANFFGNRSEIQDQAAWYALELILNTVNSI
ncbi:MAG: CinA family protein [Anaerolineales bacterium]|nr:CinA family protein [Anaerolineales bacterium]